MARLVWLVAGAMGGKAPGVRVERISANLRDLDLSFTSRVIAHSGALRLRIPRTDAEFWEIRPGDRVLVKLTKLKRETESYRETE